ncbi:unnamed protein product [Brachionus calyciflorus]|uniref:Uncharacterized protein n=1 Tax=Brachionus calyciflorus TaxID=104777 RepID=A0A814L586_9BILA|nr:unnamed protein product [Brachionus calyciflorus]
MLFESNFLLGVIYYRLFDFKNAVESFEKVKTIKTESFVYLCFSKIWLNFSAIYHDPKLLDDIFEKNTTNNNLYYLFIENFVKYELEHDEIGEKAFGNYLDRLSKSKSSPSKNLLEPFYFEKSVDAKFLVNGILLYFTKDYDKAFKSLKQYIESINWNKSLINDLTTNIRSNDYFQYLDHMEKIESTKAYLNDLEECFINKSNMFETYVSRKHHSKIVDYLAEFYFVNQLYDKYKNFVANASNKLGSVTKSVMDIRLKICDFQSIKDSYSLVDADQSLNKVDTENLDKIIENFNEMSKEVKNKNEFDVISFNIFIFAEK